MFSNHEILEVVQYTPKNETLKGNDPTRKQASSSCNYPVITITENPLQVW